jgi:Spy/CpxP family protein refolding chaperone
MSTTATGAVLSKSWSRRRVVVAALIISVVLNVFFIVGAAWTRMHPPPGEPMSPGQRFRELEGGLNLDTQQKPSFQVYAATMRERTTWVHQQIGPLIAAAWEEMAKPQPDQTHIMQLYDEAAKRRGEFQRDVTDATLKFLTVLTPAQHDKFIAIARERRPPWARQAGPASH